MRRFGALRPARMRSFCCFAPDRNNASEYIAVLRSTKARKSFEIFLPLRNTPIYRGVERRGTACGRAVPAPM